MSSNNIDHVWESLKSEGGISIDANRILRTSTKPKPTSEAGVQRFHFDIGRPFDIDTVASQYHGKKPAESSDVQDEGIPSSDLLSALDISVHESPSSAGPINCDSDDEDDEDGKENVPPPKPQLGRIERVAQALNGDDIPFRVSALTTLRDAIKALVAKPPPPELDYDPPYDERDLIKSNNDLPHPPMVSDFVRPKLLESSEPQTPSSHPSHNYEPRNQDRDHLQSVLNICGKPLFRLVGDRKSEKCRFLSLECLQLLLLSGLDTRRHCIPYLIPALCARYPPSTYDKEIDVFVHDNRSHEFFKRGGAVSRQDRDGLISHNGIFNVIEPSEELRLETCRTFSCLLRCVAAMGAERTLDAYYSDMVISLETHLKDPCNEVKVSASHLLVQLLRIPHWGQGAKFFALGLARSAIPNCRHRNTNVVLAAMDLFEAGVCVPDRAKVKGAGTAAIADLVGYQQENVLPVAAFYDSKCNVNVNTLAELASHKNHRVRLRCCQMLSYFLIYLPDSYDHQQRLLPYVLSFINDGMQEIQAEAVQCLEKCGMQYESQHPDEVIERRQFGVDGEVEIDYDAVDLPKPFTSRPSLGARLFVRANTSRFFLAVLSELSSWKEQTRKSSADLLLTLTVYCEEHLTKDFQHLIAALAKAIDAEMASRCDNDHLSILEKIDEVLRLMAKYINPDVYIPLIRPRILGDATSKSRSCARILSCFVESAPLQGLLPHWLSLASLLSSANCTETRQICSDALFILIERVERSAATDKLLESGESADRVGSILYSCIEALREIPTDATRPSVDGGRIECISKIAAAIDPQNN